MLHIQVYQLELIYQFLIVTMVQIGLLTQAKIQVLQAQKLLKVILMGMA